MTYQNLLAQDFLREVPNYHQLQQNLLLLSQSVPKEMELSLSLGKDSTFAFVFHVVEGSLSRQDTIEFYSWQSTSQWMETLGILRDRCMNPPSYTPTQIEILTEQLKSERLEVTRLRKIVKFMEQAL